MRKSELRELYRQIPKTEIHLHLEALASVDTIWKLKTLHNIKLPDISSRNDLVRKFQVKSLDEFISLFINVIQACFLNTEDIRFLIDDACGYLKSNNIFYAEIFFSPSAFRLNGLDFKSMMNILHEGAREIRNKEDITVKFIIDVSRTYGLENAESNLDLTLKHLNDSIIGIGLGGSEQKGRAVIFKDVFKKAHKEGLHVVAHAGEDVDSSSIWEALLDLKAQRIGHGISAVNDDTLMNYLRDYRIPLEICPTSNLFTRKYSTTYTNHPIRAFFDRDIFVTVNTDDPTIFGIDLTEEYARLFEHGIFSHDEIFRLIKNGLYATFLSPSEKDQKWKTIERTIEKLFKGQLLKG